MVFKCVVILATVVACANAGILQLQQQQQQLIQEQPQTLVLQAGPHPDELRSSPAQYEFRYSVHDVGTGDIKDQQEIREGDQVRGRYSLIEPDGNRRVVEYSSDPLLGFNANVRHEPSPYQAPITLALSRQSLASITPGSAQIDQLGSQLISQQQQQQQAGLH
ncbi:cuticle protein 7 [Episyrphus balteatus]|uniref:cuticle protein 7 n=1 Tax=Episyrphus balteatus TaxID=286459 RepID=UPI002484DF4F|nr:cuticle protein 7 [Episyrphus balteatus]